MPDLRDGFAQRLRTRDGFARDRQEVPVDNRAMSALPPSGIIRPRVIFGVATALGFFSAFQGYYYVSTFTD